jgi:hypothetical protein
MTRSTPDYDGSELTVRATQRRKHMQLDPKSILGAVGVLLAEQNKTIAELRATITASSGSRRWSGHLPRSRLRAVGGE